MSSIQNGYGILAFLLLSLLVSTVIAKDCGDNGFLNPINKTNCVCLLGYTGENCTDCVHLDLETRKTFICCPVDIGSESGEHQNVFWWNILAASEESLIYYLSGQYSSIPCVNQGEVIDDGIYLDCTCRISYIPKNNTMEEGEGGNSDQKEERDEGEGGDDTHISEYDTLLASIEDPWQRELFKMMYYIKGVQNPSILYLSSVIEGSTKKFDPKDPELQIMLNNNNNSGPNTSRTGSIILLVMVLVLFLSAVSIIILISVYLRRSRTEAHKKEEENLEKQPAQPIQNAQHRQPSQNSQHKQSASPWAQKPSARSMRNIFGF